VYPVVVMAQDAPESEPYPVVTFPDGSWLPYKQVQEICGPWNEACFEVEGDCIHVQAALLLD